MSLFHQDWTHDGDTALHVVANDLARSETGHALALHRDARALGHLPSSTLKVLWEAGSQYIPPLELIGGGSAWTRTVADLCDAWLAADTHQALTGDDCEDGIGSLDAVLSEIEAARFLPAKVRAALADCARRSTPDLAFRIMLRTILCTTVASLSAEQYGRLEAIGSAMRYGEFVVASVRYLVEES
jgi:hypothetical protein